MINNLDMKKILFLLLFITSIVSAQQAPKVDLSTPKATVYTHIYFLQNNSYKPKSAAKTINGLAEKEAIKAAIKIKRILDGKGLKIDFNRIPADSSFKDTLGYDVVSKYILFPERMPLISVEKVGDNWYYSTETIQNIDALYAEVFPWYIEKIQDIIPGAGHKKVFSIELWQYVTFLLLLICAVLIFIISKKITFFLFRRILFNYTKNKLGDINVALKKLAHPISLLIALELISKVLPSLQLGLEVNKLIFIAVNVSAIIFWVYVFLKIAQVLVSFYHRYTEKTEGKLDDQLIPILRNFLNVVIIVIGGFRMLVQFGLDTTTILAGASIGGLALAFASQDTVKNLIGTVMIFVDKPFHIGDWISA